MAYTAQQLITRSWFLSGIVARNLQVPTGDQITDGLQMLNDLLNFKQVETDLIPYYSYITFLCTPNQEYYFLPYVADIETSTFNLDVVRYPMVSAGRRAYYGSSRVDNISTLPFSWNFQRGVGGGTMAMYFKPDKDYVMKLQAKIFLTDVSLITDLTYITLPSSGTQTFSSAQLRTAFTVTNTSGSLVINAQQPMSFGEEIQFIGGSLPSTITTSTTYYAVPINEGQFYVATTLANATAGTYIAFAAGTGIVISESLVITLPTATNLFVGDQVMFTASSGNLPSGVLPGGLSANVIYYINPSSPTTFCIATTLSNANSGTYIPFTMAGTGVNQVTFINPNNVPFFTPYAFVDNNNQGFDTSYIEYLRYALARYMCSEYGVGFNPESEKIYQSYHRKLMYVSPPDLSIRKITILNSNDQLGYNWGDVNIGHGWRNS